jgi:threonine dehydrogenase-like Zn-dependent dehydrogenase
MKALVLEKNKILKYKEIQIPEKKYENSYLVKVVASGICSSDLHRAFEGGAYFYPLVMGHEFSGTIEEGFKGAKLKKGDNVVVFPLIPCNKCTACQTGDFAQCVDYDYLGSRSSGGFAQYVYVPEKNLFLVPDHIDMVHAAVTEPAAVALHGVKKLGISPGSTGVVFGGGLIGNIAAQWLRIRGAREVIIVDIDEKKLEIAQNMGFATVNSIEKEPIESILSYTNEDGADFAVEACGLPLTFLQSIKSVKMFGQVVFMGNISGTFEIGEKDFSDILRKEIKIYGTWNSKIVPEGQNDWSTVLKYLDKELQVDELISHTPKLSEGEEVFKKLYEKTGFFNRVVFKV